MDITLNMTKEEAEATLKASKEAEVVAVNWLTQIRANIRTLEASLQLTRVPAKVYFQNILSFTYPDTVYLVTECGGTYTCECKSFTYARSLDEQHRCKHIRRAIESPYSWRS